VHEPLETTHPPLAVARILAAGIHRLAHASMVLGPALHKDPTQAVAADTRRGYAGSMTFAERRAMWREKRRMRKFWRARVAAALLALALSLSAWYSGSERVEAVALVVVGLLIFPFWSSDRRVEADWKALQARRSDGQQ